MIIVVFLYATPCGLQKYKYTGLPEKDAHRHSCTVMMEDVGYSEEPVKFYPFTRLHIVQHESCRDDFF